MNDYELNKACAEKLGCEKIMKAYDNSSVAVSWVDGKFSINFDPCNNWADAGPIMAKYEITLYPPKQLVWDLERKGFWGAKNFIVNKPKLISDPIPTRAIVRCFLDMGE